MTAESNGGFRRVLLCIPPLRESASHGYSQRDVPRAPITGIGYLSEFLSRHGIENDVIDLRLYDKGNMDALVSVLRERIARFQPDLVGFQVMTYRRDQAYALIRGIKDGKYKTVIGGHHVSTVGGVALDEVEADFAIRLEGEYPLLELCEGKPLDQIEGLAFRDGHGIAENKERPFVKDLDSIPFPRYGKYEMARYARRLVPIVTSRGCPYSCIFCPIHATIGKPFRSRSPESVVEEIRHWYDLGYREMEFVDDNFTLLPERVHRICDLIEETGLKGLTLACPNGVRADRVDRDLLKRMREVGFYRICFGVEAGNDRILKNIKKAETREQIEEAIRNACELGYDVGLFFMIGHPGETVADVQQSFELALKYPVSYANFYNIVPFPRTALLEWIKEHNYFVGDWQKNLSYAAHYDGLPFFETPEFPLAQRQAMLRQGDRITIELKKRAFLRAMGRMALLGRPVASFLFSGPVYPRFVRLYNGHRTFHVLVNGLVRLLGLKVYHL